MGWSSHPEEELSGASTSWCHCGRLEEIVRRSKSRRSIAVDTETTGLDPDAELCGISLAWQQGHGVYVPVRSPEPERRTSTRRRCSRSWAPCWRTPGSTKCGHNMKFDARVLRRAGVGCGASSSTRCWPACSSIRPEPATSSTTLAAGCSGTR